MGENLSIYLDDGLREALDLAERQLDYPNRSALIRDAILKLVMIKNKMGRERIGDIKIPEDLNRVLDKVKRKMKMEKDELVKHILWVYCEKRYPGIVGYKFPKGDKLSDLSNLDQVIILMQSKELGCSIEEAFSRMKKKRSQYQKVKVK